MRGTLVYHTFSLRKMQPSAVACLTQAGVRGWLASLSVVDALATKSLHAFCLVLSEITNLAISDNTVFSTG